MAETIKEHGRIIKCMGKEYFYLKMEGSIQGNISKIKKMAMEFLNGN